MDSGYSSENGAFLLTGCSEDLIPDIDPALRIYHKCNSQEYTKIQIELPQRFIGSVYNQTINLAQPQAYWSVSTPYVGETRPICSQTSRLSKLCPSAFTVIHYLPNLPI